MRLDDKRVDAHSELGGHGDERAVDLVKRHQNVQPQLQVRHRRDDLIQVDISGKRQWRLAVDDQPCDEHMNALDDNVVTILNEGTNVVGARGCESRN